MQLFQVVRSLLLFSGLVGSQACASDVVRTQNGDVRGVTSGQTQSFKAIPYAAPPVGALRWLPPEDPANWTGIRDASKFSPECPQTSHFDGKFTGNEDCLYLNVFKQVGANALPVIVFIHGGSNVRGSASQPGMDKDVFLYDGSSLAQKNVVVVTLNYRLGTLGFIGHPKLSETSGYKGSGNYAYMDQIQALKWVQRNIAVFGGNPSNVTLLGHSAGAKGVWVLMSSPLSKGLFHGAIVHSAVREGARRQDEADDVGQQLSKRLGCLNAPDELACMRGKSAEEVVGAMPSGPGSRNYGAVVDRKVLEATPIAVMQGGQHHHVPILQGNVADEMSTLGVGPTDIDTEEKYETAVKSLASKMGASASEMLQLYPSSEYPAPHKAYNALRADMEYLCPSRRVLTAISGKQTEFVGRFFYTHTFSGGPNVQFGAAHGFELLFVFDSLRGARVPPTNDELALVKMFQDTWSSFARTGTPPAFWKRYDAQKDNYAIFDTTMSEAEGLHAKRCKLWDTLPPP